MRLPQSRATGNGCAARKAAPAPPYRLVVFGYLSRNRRLGAILEALAGIPEREQFRLDVCGQLWDEGHIRTQIESLGWTPLVKLLGFLPEGHGGAKAEHCGPGDQSALPVDG